MHFIFGYLREVPVKIERETSTATLIVIGILVVLLFIFLSFEDIDEPARSSQLTFLSWSGSAQLGLSGELKIDPEIYPEEIFRIHPEGRLNSKTHPAKGGIRRVNKAPRVRFV